MKIKSKIALVIAASLAVAGVSTVSASANPLVVTVAGKANSTTYTGPMLVPVPLSNSIDATNTVALAVTTETATQVTFAGYGVKLVPALSTSAVLVTPANGVSSVSVTSSNVATMMYAYSTSTSIGSVTITNGASSEIVYIQGTDLNNTIADLKAQVVSLNLKIASGVSDLALEHANHANDVASLNQALATEKSNRAADAFSLNAALIAEKVSHTSDVASLNSQLDLSKWSLKVDIKALNRAYNSLLKRYNYKAHKYGFATTK